MPFSRSLPRSPARSLRIWSPPSYGDRRPGARSAPGLLAWPVLGRPTPSPAPLVPPLPAQESPVLQAPGRTGFVPQPLSPALCWPSSPGYGGYRHRPLSFRPTLRNPSDPSHRSRPSCAAGSGLPYTRSWRSWTSPLPDWPPLPLPARWPPSSHPPLRLHLSAHIHLLQGMQRYQTPSLLWSAARPSPGRVQAPGTSPAPGGPPGSVWAPPVHASGSALLIQGRGSPAVHKPRNCPQASLPAGDTRHSLAQALHPASHIPDPQQRLRPAVGSRHNRGQLSLPAADSRHDRGQRSPPAADNRRDRGQGPLLTEDRHHTPRPALLLAWDRHHSLGRTPPLADRPSPPCRQVSPWLLPGRSDPHFHIPSAQMPQDRPRRSAPLALAFPRIYPGSPPGPSDISSVVHIGASAPWLYPHIDRDRTSA